MEEDDKSEDLLMAISFVLIGIGFIFIGVFRFTNPYFVVSQPLKTTFDNIMATPVLGNMLNLAWGCPEGMVVLGIGGIVVGSGIIYSIRRQS